MSKIVKRNSDSIQKAILEHFRTQRLPIVGDEALEMMARIEFCYEQMQLYKVSLSASKGGHSPIQIKQKVLEQLQKNFDVSYGTAATIYKRATMIFDMSLVNADGIQYDILIDDTNELYAQAIQDEEWDRAEKLLARRQALLDKRPKQVIAPINNRQKYIVAAFNTTLLKVCEVVEDQAQLIELERNIKSKFQHQTKTASSLLNSYAEDIESTPIEE